MKNISEFIPKRKYLSKEYEFITEGIYKHKDKYVTAISFQQEPEFGEGLSAADISQYPLEDILDKYLVFVSDFFPELNTQDSQTCFLEFTGFTLDDIKSLRMIIGKHVYCKEKTVKNETCIELVIE